MRSVDEPSSMELILLLQLLSPLRLLLKVLFGASAKADGKQAFDGIDWAGFLQLKLKNIPEVFYHHIMIFASIRFIANLFISYRHSLEYVYLKLVPRISPIFVMYKSINGIPHKA